MKFREAAAFIFFLIAVLFFILVNILNPSIESKAVYIMKGNIFSDCFKEPFERLYVIFEDGAFFGFSTHDENMVDITPEFLKEFIEKEKKSLKDAVIMMHNHFGMPKVSKANIRFLQSLKQYGYKGSFCVYDTAANKIICEEEK